MEEDQVGVWVEEVRPLAEEDWCQPLGGVVVDLALVAAEEAGGERCIIPFESVVSFYVGAECFWFLLGLETEKGLHPNYIVNIIHPLSFSPPGGCTRMAGDISRVTFSVAFCNGQQ